MAHGHCLYRRASGIYAVRIVVPRHLRSRVGRGEIHVSTGCNVRSVALGRAFASRARWRSLFKQLTELDALSLRTAAPHLRGAGLIQLVRAAQLLDLEPLELARQVMALEGNIWCYASDWPARYVESTEHVEREDGVHQWPSVVAWGQERRLTGALSLMMAPELLHALERGGRAEPYWVNHAPIDMQPLGAVFVEPGAVRIAVCDLLVQVRDVDRVRLGHLAAAEAAEQVAWKARTDSDRNGATGMADGQADLQLLGDRTAAHGSNSLGPSSRGNRLISELIGAYIAEMSSASEGFKAKWKPDEADRQRQKLRVVPELLGDVPVSQLEDPEQGRALMSELVTQLARLPTGPALAKARRECKDAGAVELIAWADRNSAPRFKPPTVKNYLQALSSCLKWAKESGSVRANVAKAKAGALSVPQRERVDEKRQKFNGDELTAIFSAPWFTTGGAPLNKGGKRTSHYRPFYYWIPLLALYLGGRANELAQLYLSDFGVDSFGNPHVTFQVEHADQIFAEDDDDIPADGASRSGPVSIDRSLKTVNARRSVPIHRFLVELGLLRYVDALRRQGEVRLFPELRFDERKGYGLEARKWFNERFLGKMPGLPRNGKKVLHSMRHNFASAISSDPAVARLKAQLLGHRRGEALGEQRYTGDREIAILRELIDALDYGLPTIASFDVQDGLRAVEQAKKLKKSFAHRRSKAT